jgi:hypothetical protein
MAQSQWKLVKLSAEQDDIYALACITPDPSFFLRVVLHFDAVPKYICFYIIMICNILAKLFLKYSVNNELNSDVVRHTIIITFSCDR